MTLYLVNVASLTPGTYSGTITFTNADTGIGNTTRTATLTINGALYASPAFGSAPLTVTFTTFVAQEETGTYTVNFGDGTVSGPMIVRPSGIACTVKPPCFTGIVSTSHTYTSPGTYSAVLLNSFDTSIATTTITVVGTAPRVSQSGRGQALPPRSMPLMQSTRPAFGGIGTVGPPPDNSDRYPDDFDEVNK